MSTLENHYDIFVATSFSSRIDDNGDVQPEYREYVEGILREIRELGMRAFCAAEFEGWRIGEEPPEVGVKLDLEMIDASDSFLALIGSEKSEGRSHEVGHASAKGKAVYFMLEPGVERFGYWNQGVVALGLAKVIKSVDEISWDKQVEIAELDQWQ